MPKIYNGERIVSSVNDAGKTGFPHKKKKKKKEIGFLPYTMYKNQLQMD